MVELATIATELTRLSDISSPCQLKPISIQENHVASLGVLLFAENNVQFGLNGQHKDWQ